jgi:hypothetical protein
VLSTSTCGADIFCFVNKLCFLSRWAIYSSRLFFFESLASQGSKFFLTKCLACSMPSSDSLPVPPGEVLAMDTGNGYQLLQDIDGGPQGEGGAAVRSDSIHH